MKSYFVFALFFFVVSLSSPGNSWFCVFQPALAKTTKPSLSPKSGQSHQHENHEAHVHGQAKMDMAFDHLKGVIEFKSAAQSVLGFEHNPHSKKEIDLYSEIKNQFENHFSELVSFDAILGCEIQTESVQFSFGKKSGHGDFSARYRVECKKDIQGSQLKFDFSKIKNLKDLDVTLLTDQLQKSFEIESSPMTFNIK